MLKDDLYNSENKSYKPDFFEASLRTGSILGAGAISSRLLGNMKVPKTQVGNLRFVNHFTVNGRPWYEHVGKSATDYATVKELIWNAVKASEEQVGKILRTYSASSWMGEGILSRSAFDITQDIYEQQKELLNIHSKGIINDRSFTRGIKYVNGKILFSDTGETALKNARIIPGRWGDGLFRDGKDIGYTSRWTEGFHKVHNVKTPRSDFFIIGGQNKLNLFGRKANSVFTVAVQNYVRLLDDPFEFIGSYLGQSRFTRGGTKWLDRLSLKNLFGVGGRTFSEMGSGVELLKRHAQKGMPRIAAGLMALYGINTLLGSTPVIKDTKLGSGIPGIMADAYQKGTLAYSHLSDVTGLTGLSKLQEEASPGSTSILGNLSHGASYAIAGGTAGGLLNLIQKTPLDAKPVAPQWFQKAASKIESFSSAGQRLGLSRLGRTGAFAATGAAIGFALALPNMLGALGSSKSSEELEAIYSGKRMVAHKRGRWWEAGQSPFEGNDIEYFRPHWSVIAKSDAVNRGKLPEEYYQNPIRRWFDRLFDPYALERRLNEERPYKYWGPTDYGLGFIEKLFSPIKEAMKPTILANPDEGGVHPGRIKRRGVSIPSQAIGSAEGIATGGYLPETVAPNSLRSYASETAHSLEELMGLQGFTLSALSSQVTGTTGALAPNAQDESSGRIMSAQRSYWDLGIGGGAGTTEAYRRLNSHRSYNTEYVSSSVKNAMPDWMPEGALRYGDPFAQMPFGEVRLPGRGYCVHPETKVQTDNGFKEIQDITTSDKALTSDGYKNIIDVMSRDYSGELIVIKSYGSLTEETKLTPEHQVKAIRTNICKYHKDTSKKRRPCKKGNFCHKMKCNDYNYLNIEWIQAKDLEEGDYVLLPKLNEPDNNYIINVPQIVESDLLEYIGENTYQTYSYLGNTKRKNKQIKLTIPDSHLTWWIFGLYLAEGSLSRNKAGVSGVNFALSQDEIIFCDYIKYLIPNATYRNKDGGIVVDANNKIFGLFIENIFGSSNNKQIPRNLSRLQFINLLSGMFQGDGARDKESTNLTIAFKYQQLLNDIIWYLTKFNIDYSIKTRKDRQCYEIRILASSIHELVFINGKEREISSNKTISNFEIDNHRAFKIRSITTEEYNGTVYDIEVNDTHEFTTSFIIHNSALHPELEGVDPEDYPLVHRMNILHDVSPNSLEYLNYKNLVERQIQSGELNDAGVDMYNEIIRQDQELQNQHKFDYGEGAFGAYNLALKKFGRSLPTEALYPVSPVHKFAGPVDPIGEYKSQILLDKRYKLWQNPISDFIIPAINRTIDATSMGDYIPPSASEHAYNDSYFNALQEIKNKHLSELASQESDPEMRRYYRSGIRDTISGESPYGNVEELKNLLPHRQQQFLDAFLSMDEESDKRQALAIASPEIQQILAAQYNKNRLMAEGNFEGLRQVKSDTMPISGLSEQLVMGKNAPDKDFLGYAPGVDLNAYKLKVIDDMGHNIRDYGLWREDERSAQILDAMTQAQGIRSYSIMSPISSSGLSKKGVEDALFNAGMRGARVTSVPSFSGSSVNMEANANNESELQQIMHNEGWISF